LSTANEPDDRELARSAQAGSFDAFEELVRRYEGRIYRFVLRVCGNVEDARDITQDAFVRAFRMLDRYDTALEFAPWLFTLARRRAIDHLRSFPPASGAAVPELPNPEDPASVLECREQHGALWTFARKVLSDLQFQALWFHYAEEMDTTQVAAVLGISPTHTKVLLGRARLLLARRLKTRAMAEETIHSTGLTAEMNAGAARQGLSFLSKGSL
jgi:RNA polymerase sigma-70 factor (ECF subfamily)